MTTNKITIKDDDLEMFLAPNTQLEILDQPLTEDDELLLVQYATQQKVSFR